MQGVSRDAFRFQRTLVDWLIPDSCKVAESDAHKGRKQQTWGEESYAAPGS